MEKRRIIFNKDRFKVHRILEHLVNASAQTQEWYDERVRLFPALNIEVVLIK